MTQKEMAAMVEMGGVFATGSYWSGRIDTLSLRDPKTTERRVAYVTREVILGDADPIPVSRFLRDGENPTEWKPSAKRGQKCVVKVTSMETQSGNISLRGTIEPVI